MTVSPALDRDTALARINAAAAHRPKYLEALLDAAAEAVEAQELVTDAARRAQRADAAYAEAFKDALDAGWTAAELSEGGLTAPAPGKKARSSSKRRGSSTRAATPRRRVGLTQQPADSIDAPVPPQQHHDSGTGSPSPTGI